MLAGDGMVSYWKDKKKMELSLKSGIFFGGKLTRLVRYTRLRCCEILAGIDPDFLFLETTSFFWAVLDDDIKVQKLQVVFVRLERIMEDRIG